MNKDVSVRVDRLVENDYQTEGFMRVLADGIDWNCKTLELPWRNNERRVSRIPAGTYQAHLHMSPKFNHSIWIRDVPDRSEILTHRGNYHTNTLGCILVGDQFIDIDGDGHLDVTNSKLVMLGLYRVIESLLGDDKAERFEFRIVDRFQ